MLRVLGWLQVACNRACNRRISGFVDAWRIRRKTMTTKPPVPAENQSPYPIEEPPHDHSHDNETVAAVREIAAAKARRQRSARQLGIGAAVGIGSAAIVAGLLFWRGNRKDGK
jgi:hypothetical protein